MMEPFRQRIVVLIAQYIKFIFTFIYLTESSRPFCLKHSRHKERFSPPPTGKILSFKLFKRYIDCFSTTCELIKMAGQMQNMLWGREVMK